MRGIIIAAAVALATSAVSAPGPKAANTTLDLPLEGVNTNPDWRARPTGEQVGQAYPKIAQMLSIAGRAKLQCVAEPNGAVDSCEIEDEAPVGLGFGAAAESLAPKPLMTSIRRASRFWQ